MTLGFMTVALGARYLQYVAPYITSTLTTYPKATCEIRVDHPEEWHQRNKRLVATLNEMFPDRWLVTEVGFAWRKRRLIPNTVRFVSRPSTQLHNPQMLYIGDVDIVVSVPGIVEFHSNAMKELGLPYSNVIRPKPKQDRLSGLHVVKTKPYFAKITPAAQEDAIRRWAAQNDEAFLLNMCKKHIGLPSKRLPRPVYGIHPSPQRPIHRNDGCHWGVKQHLQNHLELIQSEQWRTLFPLFKKEFREKMKKVERWIEKNG